VRTFDETENVFDMIAGFHRTLKERYDRLTDEAEKERVKMLLDYLSRHERRFEQGLEQYSEQGRRKVLDTWYQYIPDGQTLDPGSLDLTPDMTVDEVVDTALKMDERLKRFFESMAENAGSPPEVREVFRKMVEQEEREKAKLVKTAEQIKRL
jgi:hypothetical protein